MNRLFKRNRDRGESSAKATAPAVPSSKEDTRAVSSTKDSAATEQDSGGRVNTTTVTPQEQIEAAYKEWHAALSLLAAQGSRPMSAVDTSVIDITSPHPTGAAQLKSGMPTLLSSLVRERNALKAARKRLVNLTNRITELSEQYGYAPVSLAIGELTWSELPQSHDGENEDPIWLHHAAQKAEGSGSAQFAVSAVDTGATLAVATGAVGDSSTANDDSAEQTPAASPTPATSSAPAARAVHVMMEAALIRTIRLEPAGNEDAYITLTARCEINPVVLRALRNHGIDAEAIADLRECVADPSREDEALARIRELGRAYLPGFGYETRTLVGNFVHPGNVLLADLEAMKPYIETSGVMAALAGDRETASLTAAPLPPPERRDRTPEAERGAGDRDVDELAAIEAVAAGRSIVINTPPGSQKVGTLAGIVADAAASGRSVLYIPGRASAGRSFVDEMAGLGLEDLVLDFSELENVAMRLRTGLRQREEHVNTEAILAMRSELTRTRKELGRYIEDLHRVDPTWGESVYSLLQRLAALTSTPDSPRSQVRLTPETVHNLAGKVEEVRADLHRAAHLGVLSATNPGAVWAGARITSAEEGEKAIARASRLASETLPVIMAQSQRVAAETGLTRATSFAVWLEQINMLEGVATTLDVFTPQIYERSAMDMVIATATREWRDRHGESMKGSERRRLTRQARDMLRPGASVTNLHEELAKVQRQRDVWRRYCVEGGWPKLPDGMAQIKATASEGIAELRSLEQMLAEGTRLASMPMEELLGFTRQLAAGGDIMETLPQRNHVENQLKMRGLGDFLEDLRQRGVGEEKIDDELDLVYASSVFEQLVSTSTALAEIGPADLTRMCADLRRLDKEHTQTLAAPVRRAVIRLMRETISQRREDTIALDGQLERYSTGALRDVIATYPRLVQVARPAWVIPSMMAVEFIPTMPWADVVIIDEADSVECAWTISMLMRGHQVVLMGDLQRATEHSAGASFAEILPVCELPTDRAKYDALAAHTLSEQGYASVLTPVPEVPRADRARLTIVDGQGIPSPTTGMVESPRAEVEAVIQAVINHTMTQPEHSLAVVCVSKHHAARLREAVKKLVARSATLSSLAITDVREPFTVVDITSCAGLRRDSIILSVGLGKTSHGRVIHSFGALSTPAGVTGLVEAVGAARTELQIISSLAPGDIKLERISSPGPRLLAHLIDRAGGESLPLDPAPQAGLVAPLINDLAVRLRAKGWQVAANFGYENGVQIPLVAGDSSLRGVWRVAVLVDDEAYAREASLRRRDRYWIERLEERGWIVVQTFSTSLFIDLDGQADAVDGILRRLREETLAAASTALGFDPSSRSMGTPRGASSQPGDDTASDVGTIPGDSGVQEESSFTASLTETADSKESGLEKSASVLSAVRSPRPRITPGLPLAAYTDDQLDEMLTWIVSDRIARSEDELLEVLRDELALHRRGVQIETVLRNVVRRSGYVSEETGTSTPLTDTATQGMEALKERLTGQIPVARVDEAQANTDSEASSSHE